MVSCRTHLACRTSAAIPAMRGAEALVPVKESVQPPSGMVLDWREGPLDMFPLHLLHVWTYHLIIGKCTVECFRIEGVGYSNLACAVLIIESLSSSLVC